MITARITRDPMLALVRIAQALDAATTRWTTCAGCGCLAHPLEACPGCKAARLVRDERGSALLSALVILACWSAVMVVGLALLAGWTDQVRLP